MKIQYHIVLFFILTCLFSMPLFAQTTKLMTYNLRYDNLNDGKDTWNNRKKKVVELIDFYRPEIFGIQEGLDNQVQFLNRQLAHYSYVGVGRDNGKREGEYAAIFYNSKMFEVVEQATFWLSEKPDSISVGWDASMERICTYALFQDKKTAQKIWVFNTHFDHKGKKAQVNSAALIAQVIETKTKGSNIPVILMGDLNVTPNSKAIKTLKKTLEDTFDSCKQPHYGPNSTFNGFQREVTINKRIDYIFVKNFNVFRHIHLDDRLDNSRFPSDHYPVLIEGDFSN